LAALYELPFGGKDRGRFQISMKLMREMTGRRRLYEEDIKAIGRELLELGYVLIDMETYFCVLDHRTLANYRRINAEHLHDGASGAAAKRNSRRGSLQ
jgi:predicted AAA+ superfamily ATPase